MPCSHLSGGHRRIKETPPALASVGFAAALGPASRVSNVDPIQALRSEGFVAHAPACRVDTRVDAWS